MAVSNTRQIPPGSEGKITVEIHTGGHGGEKIRKDVHIMTNDTIKPWLSITMTGYVKKSSGIRH